MDIRYANHPSDAKHYTTQALRDHFLKTDVFVPGQISLTYSHQDRMIFGGAMPIASPLFLEASDTLRADYFLERRELGVINIGGAGILTLEGTAYTMANQDGMYVGMGTKDIAFQSVHADDPAKFYLCSSPAHTSYPNQKINFADANPRTLGDPMTMNRRTIYQYVHPAVCKSCQLTMGLTQLEPGNAWNTMPCHTHERRMEVYFYFNLPEDCVVFHLMGKPDETRHIVMRNEQAVISPSWSIHSGVGTHSYTFIWGMCGENQAFDDMDTITTSTLI